MARIGSLEDEPFIDTDFDTFPHRQGSDPFAEFRGHVEGLNDTEFWDYDRFVEELHSAGLSQRAIELLQHVTMNWESANVHTEDWTDFDYRPSDEFPQWYDRLDGP